MLLSLPPRSFGPKSTRLTYRKVELVNLKGKKKKSAYTTSHQALSQRRRPTGRYKSWKRANAIKSSSRGVCRMSHLIRRLLGRRPSKRSKNEMTPNSASPAFRRRCKTSCARRAFPLAASTLPDHVNEKFANKVRLFRFVFFSSF